MTADNRIRILSTFQADVDLTGAGCWRAGLPTQVYGDLTKC